MGIYSRFVFPLLCDWALNQPFIARQRAELLAAARGEILEIGFGTGLNLRHYPPEIRRITVADPNPGMHRKARRRIEQAHVEVDQRLVRGEQLPFDAEAFDCVVSTFTLCSIEDVGRALGEVHRVLRPGGTFLFLEHGLAPEPSVQRWQRRLNPLQQRLGDNCHLDRNIRALVTGQPFSRLELREFYLEKGPPTHSYVYQGAAEK